MQKEKITTRKCPVCLYEHKVIRLYDIQKVKRKKFFSHEYYETEKDIFLESEVVKGDAEFIFNVDDVTDNKYKGMFCPKCGVLLNVVICTKTEETTLLII